MLKSGVPGMTTNEDTRLLKSCYLFFGGGVCGPGSKPGKS